jgi:hypothetical protein
VRFLPASMSNAGGGTTRALLEGAQFVRFAAGKVASGKPGAGDGGGDDPGFMG